LQAELVLPEAKAAPQPKNALELSTHDAPEGHRLVWVNKCVAEPFAGVSEEGDWFIAMDREDPRRTAGPVLWLRQPQPAVCQVFVPSERLVSTQCPARWLRNWH